MQDSSLRLGGSRLWRSLVSRFCFLILLPLPKRSLPTFHLLVPRSVVFIVTGRTKRRAVCRDPQFLLGFPANSLLMSHPVFVAITGHFLPVIPKCVLQGSLQRGYIQGFGNLLSLGRVHAARGRFEKPRTPAGGEAWPAAGQAESTTRRHGGLPGVVSAGRRRNGLNARDVRPCGC